MNQIKIGTCHSRKKTYWIGFPEFINHGFETYSVLISIWNSADMDIKEQMAPKAMDIL